MATPMADHRAVVAAVLLVLAAAVGAAAQPEPEPAAGAGTGGPPPLVVRVRCTGLHVVRPGETCASVARAEGMTDGQFAALNPKVTCPAMLRSRRVCIRGSAIG